jgi:cell division septation protein DedD
VVELTHDTDDGFHEIQLSGKQLVFLFIVATTVIVVVFLCGVRVGRGARDAQGDEIDQAALASVPAPQAASPVATPPSEPPAPVADGGPQDDLSYQHRLGANTPAAEKLKKQDEPKREAASAPVPIVEPKSPAPVATPAPKPAPQVATAPPKTAATTGSTTPSVADNLPTSGRPGTWAVQVIATRDRAVAGSVVKRLAAKGYPAFVVNPASGAKQPFYKVHVGRYNDRGEAEKVSLRIKKEEQFQSWITR